MRTSKGQLGGAGMIVVFLLAVAGGAYVADSAGVVDLGLTAAEPGQPGGQAPLAASCGADNSCTVTFNYQNVLNETGTETRDVTAYIKGAGGAVNQQITDTTDKDVTVSPGEYTIAVASGTNNNANLVGISQGTIDANGVATVQIQNNNVDLTLEGTDHGGVEAKVFDNNANNFLNTSASVTANPGDFEADGTTFVSNDDTKIAVGSGGDLSMTFTMRQDTTDEEFSDLGTIVAVAAPTDKYDEPSVRWEGDRLQEQGSSVLTSEGQNAVGTTYNHFYRLPAGAFNDVSNPGQIKHDLDFDISALSGVDPADADDIQVDLIAEGRYERVGTQNDLAVSTHQDDSSFTAVHTIMDFTLDIT